MEGQGCSFLHLPLELRLMVYGYLFDDMLEKILWHPILSVSDQISDEVMPLLLKSIVCYFHLWSWNTDHWRLFVQPRTRIWEIPVTTNHSEDLWRPPKAVIKLVDARYYFRSVVLPTPDRLCFYPTQPPWKVENDLEIYQARRTAIKLYGPRPEKLTIWAQRRRQRDS